MWVPVPVTGLVNPLMLPAQPLNVESAPSLVGEDSHPPFPLPGQQLLSEAFGFLGSNVSIVSSSNNRVISGAVVAAGASPPPLSERRPAPSAGSVMHGTGRCNPCAHYWKERGCTLDADCDFCHLCEDGELRRRRKARYAVMRACRMRGGRA